MTEKIDVTIGSEVFTVSLEDGVATVNGRQYAIDAVFTGSGNVSLLVDGAVSYACIVGVSIHPREYHLAAGKPFQINVDGHTHDVLVEDRRSRLLKSLKRAAPTSSGSCDIVAPMPGLVAKVQVSAGAHVKSGQGVLILEAMKMENEIRAPQGGRIKEILVQPGQAVEKGQLLGQIISEREK